MKLLVHWDLCSFMWAIVLSSLQPSQVRGIPVARRSITQGLPSRINALAREMGSRTCLKRSPKVEGIEELLWPGTLIVNCTTEKGGGMTVTTKGQYVFNDFKQGGNEYVSGLSKKFCDYLIETGAIKA